MKFLKLATLIVATLLSLNASARETVAIVNHQDVAITTSSGKPVLAAQVKQAILAAASARNWSATNQGDGKIVATLNVRNKHTVTVDITYAADRYSLNYKDSTNMKYGDHDGMPVIHPYYNKWVQELQRAIRTELLKL